MLSGHRLVLESRSLEFPDRRHRGVGFVFNMNRVFESFLETVLRERLERFGGRVEGQYPVHLDEAATVLMKPDVVWWWGGRCRDISGTIDQIETAASSLAARIAGASDLGG